MVMFNGSLIVADEYNFRVRLFNVSPLLYVRELISPSERNGRPHRMAIRNDGNQLFVAFTDASENVRTFNVTRI